MLVCLGVTYTMSKEGTKELFMSEEIYFSLVKFLRPNGKATQRVTSATKDSKLRALPKPDVGKTATPAPAFLTLP